MRGQNEALKCIIVRLRSWPRPVQLCACVCLCALAAIVLLAFHFAIAACLEHKYALSGLLTTKQIIIFFALFMQYNSDADCPFVRRKCVYFYFSFASSLHVY